MAENDINKAIAENGERRFQAQVASMASDLRHLAERIEREARRPATPGTPRDRATWRAANVQHALIWDFANLNMDGLIEAAVEADTPHKDES